MAQRHSFRRYMILRQKIGPVVRRERARVFDISEELPREGGEMRVVPEVRSVRVDDLD